jgi:hypothetical protein
LESTAIPHLAASLLTVIPLVYAAVAKALGPTESSDGLRRLGVNVPPPVIAAAESLIASTLVLINRWETALLLAATYAIFTLVLERARRRGVAGDCGCFGRLGGRINTLAVLRNAALVVGALALAAARRSGSAEDYELLSGVVSLAMLAVASGVIDTFLVVTRTVGVRDH